MSRDQLVPTDLVVVFAPAGEISTGSEVADLGVIRCDKQDVSGRQVAVDNAVSVQISHSLRHLMHQLDDARHSHLAVTDKIKVKS